MERGSRRETQKKEGFLMADDEYDQDIAASPGVDDAEDEHAGQNHYFLSYERDDGEVVEEAIWARNHQAAIRVARKHGLARLLSRGREASHSGGRTRNPMTSHFLLPLFVAICVTVFIVALFAWRRGLF